MTANNIVKELERRKHGFSPLSKMYKNLTDAINLINRQKDEIDKLKVRNEKLKRYFTVEIAVDEKKLEEMIEKSADEIVKRNLKELRAEAIREFAERLKTKMLDWCFDFEYYSEQQLAEEQVDNLAKEMTEGENDKN